MGPAGGFGIGHRGVSSRQQEFVRTRSDGGVAEWTAVNMTLGRGQGIISVESQFLAKVDIPTDGINVDIVAGIASPVIVGAVAAFSRSTATQRQWDCPTRHPITGGQRFVVTLIRVFRK